jgi:cytochrome b6
MPRDPAHRPLGSIFRHGLGDTEKNRLLAVLSNLWLHLHPVRVPRDALRLRATLCAGGLAFFLFLLTVVSGLLLMFQYRPSTAHAHLDVVSLGQAVYGGALLRALHRYAGDAMVILVVVHTARVLLARAYRAPRELNWVVGVVLLLLTLAMAFTGYLLPFDQKGYWATTVASEMLSSVPLLGSEGPLALLGPENDLRALLLGGSAVGPATLLRFYVLHCALIPLGAGLLMALHFWRVRKDGFSGPY